MATMDGSLLQGTSGRVGQVVIYNRMGRWCVRRHVEHIRDRRSEAQLRQRGRFLTLIRLASAVREALAVGLRGEARAEGLLDSNLFLRLNKGCAAEGGEVDYRRLQLSAGPLEGVAFRKVRFEGGVFEGRFERSAGSGRSSATDYVQLYAYCPALRAGLLSLPVYRMDRRLRLALPAWMQGQEVHFYGSCWRRRRPMWPSAGRVQKRATTSSTRAATQ